VDKAPNQESFGVVVESEPVERPPLSLSK